MSGGKETGHVISVIREWQIVATWMEMKEEIQYISKEKPIEHESDKREGIKNSTFSIL